MNNEDIIGEVLCYRSVIIMQYCPICDWEEAIESESHEGTIREHLAKHTEKELRDVIE